MRDVDSRHGPLCFFGLLGRPRRGRQPGVRANRGQKLPRYRARAREEEVEDRKGEEGDEEGDEEKDESEADIGSCVGWDGWPGKWPETATAVRGSEECTADELADPASPTQI